MGAFKKGNSIQFVGNSVDPSSFPKRAAVYHGFIENLESNPSLTANIISYDSLDIGYPNIVFTGNDTCNSASVIAFNHTSKDHFAGTSVIRYKNGKYSKLKYLKEGENFVDRLSGPYERWGDYYGLQTKFNEPGVVWAAGFYGNKENDSRTWFSEIRDCACFSYSVSEEQLSFNQCDGRLLVDVNHGVPPYKYVLNGDTMLSLENYTVNLCDYQETLKVIDSKGCGFSSNEFSKINLPERTGVLYPNPAYTSEVSLYFSMPKDDYISIDIFSEEGKLVTKLLENKKAEKGQNLLQFTTAPMESGMYFVKVYSGKDVLLMKKLVIP